MRTPITAEAAQLPNALSVAQRPLPGELVYRFWDWVRDAWAGHRDSSIMRAMLDQERELPPTPWMVGHAAGLATAVHRERRDATSLEAPLRKSAFALVERHALLSAQHQSTLDAIETARAEPLTAGATTAGEHYDTADQIRARREREHQARVAAAHAAAREHENQTARIITTLAELREEFNFQESIYQRRVEALRSFYAKRQAVYARHALHGATRDGQPPILPDINMPTLTSEPFPALTTLPNLTREGTPS